MNAFLVVPVGVGHQNPVGVFYERAQAEAAATECWNASDGYHTFEIQERKIGVVYDSFPRGLWGTREPTTKPVEMTFIPEADQKRTAS